MSFLIQISVVSMSLISFLPTLSIITAAQADASNSRGKERIYYYINDHLGRPQPMINENGNVVWQADYKPFGAAEITVNAVSNDFRFPGQSFDQETGLHYNYHRYYDPKTGRYLTPDPIGLAAGINLYTYVRSDPVNWVDPDGQIAAQAIGGLVGGAFGAYAAYTYTSGDREQTLRGGIVGAGAGVLSTIPIPGINPLLGGMAISATASFLGNVVSQLASGSSTDCLDYESAGWSALAGGLGGFSGSAAAGVVTTQGLPILTHFGSEMVGSIIGGVSAGGLDVLYHK